MHCLFIKCVYLFKTIWLLKTNLKQYVFNDPIYGFIRINDPLILELIETPYFQRLRRIAQVGLSSLVYPGAHHTRFHHALGCVHLMQQSISVLQSKGVAISAAESRALQIAILLHDIGHGPFSHAMEHSIIPNISHETLSLKFMHILNDQFKGALSLAISIFRGESERLFFNQLVSSQLDVDRLDYLKRDSFYTGVAEGNINSERLISMLNVVDQTLVIEEKGLYSVEKYLMARRFMYWQVYLHKTGIAAEAILIKIFERAKTLLKQGVLLQASDALMYFLNQSDDIQLSEQTMEQFSKLDDTDIYAAIKTWSDHNDVVLSHLCVMILNRSLLKIKIKDTPFSETKIASKTKLLEAAGYSKETWPYFVFSGTFSNLAYNPLNTPIYMIKKSGKKVNIATQLAPSFFEALSHKVEKYYICYPKKGF
ncbi:MAG: HD domain-containing protein [Flavobacteriaceae bacterium]|nr:HD domain-containing protein [Flavobacteriaceae bacterium]MBT5586035.1 HD domain-containing protein [Flavobacteriaceae bacterium]MBT5921104.1 HD domain-containing protein [Flavobacteriaceae bacterium]MBT7239421.1 HD domain-containing protein [Flavobacteriaceae bacterium]MCO4778824.1 HD domain-containing protein [Flavobacteriaceae bacterium]|tara:strand:- start:47177 stop:48451 length:1275 start_codon:yes stop_codon:yes gene_type:complete